jgi:hypothetical protein
MLQKPGCQFFSCGIPGQHMRSPRFVLSKVNAEDKKSIIQLPYATYFQIRPEKGKCAC